LEPKGLEVLEVPKRLPEEAPLEEGALKLNILDTV
jgi:hypothetical protein